jgi:hypothetical protein
MGVRLKWCGDELAPTRSSKSPGSFSRRFAPQGVGFREVLARCRKAALNEQGTRGVRRKALNRSQLECLSLGEWSRTKLVAAVTAASTSSRSERARGEVRVVRAMSPDHGKGSACDLCGQPSPHATRLSGRSEVTPVNNEGVSPLSCARTHGGGEETTTLR